MASLYRCAQMARSFKPLCLGESLLFSQQRGVKGFVRIPKYIIPAEGDKEKISVKNYVKTVGTDTNPEVLAEQRALSKIFKEHKHDEANLDAKLSSISKVFNNEVKEKRKEQSEGKESHLDPEIRKALDSLDFEAFATTNNAKYRGYLRNCQTKKKRDESNMIMLEGPKLIREAIARDLVPVAVYFSRKKLLLEMMPQDMHLQEKTDRLGTYMAFHTNYKTLTQWSSTVKNQGVIAIFNKQEAENVHFEKERFNSKTKLRGARLTVVLDGVREPGNLGAILRTAAAVGAGRAVLTKGCCDPWENKALRAGCGAHFAMQLFRAVPWSAVANVTPEDPTVFLADICNSDRERMRNDDFFSAEERDVHVPGVLRAGRHTNQNENIPLEEEEEEDSHSLASKGYIEYTEDSDGNVLKHDRSYEDIHHLETYANADLPSEDYRSTDFFRLDDGDDIVLIIGSETGLSLGALKLAVDNDGQKVSIPLLNSMESLNTSVAAGVILYEILAQTQRLKVTPGRQESVASDV